MTSAAEIAFIRARSVVEQMASTSVVSLDLEASRRWHAAAYAVVKNLCGDDDASEFDENLKQLRSQEFRFDAASRMKELALRALALAEFDAPPSVQGSFIPAGNALDAMAAVGRVIQQASADLLVVDPYMDEQFLTDFTGMVAPRVKLRLLADKAYYKASLRPAVARWKTQHGEAKPIEARLATAKTLHDRLIMVDGKTVWSLTQSFNGLAKRSPASIIRVDEDVAALKVEAYEVVWMCADEVIGG